MLSLWLLLQVCAFVLVVLVSCMCLVSLLVGGVICVVLSCTSEFGVHVDIRVLY